MKRTPHLVLALICLLGPSLVEAKDKWISLQSSNFSLLGNVGEKELRQVAGNLE